MVTRRLRSRIFNEHHFLSKRLLSQQSLINFGIQLAVLLLAKRYKVVISIVNHFRRINAIVVVAETSPSQISVLVLLLMLQHICEHVLSAILILLILELSGRICLI